mgnify:CR=1 FL=1
MFELYGCDSGGSDVCLIREYGGFDALLNWIHKIFHGKKGGQLGMGLLVGTMDIATANNTVAIVMAIRSTKEMATGVWNHTPKDCLLTGYFFLYLSGNHSIWCTDACGNFCSQ